MHKAGRKAAMEEATYERAHRLFIVKYKDVDGEDIHEVGRFDFVCTLESTLLLVLDCVLEHQYGQSTGVLPAFPPANKPMDQCLRASSSLGNIRTP